MDKKLIKVNDIRELVADGISVRATACPVDGLVGHYVAIEANGEEFVLSTWVSEVRTFKRSDALLKEMRSLGLTAVTFEL